MSAEQEIARLRDLLREAEAGQREILDLDAKRRQLLDEALLEVQRLQQRLLGENICPCCLKACSRGGGVFPTADGCAHCNEALDT